MGFEPEYDIFLNKSKNDPNYNMRKKHLNYDYMEKVFNKKLNVARKYQKFLYRIFTTALKYLEKAGDIGFS